MERAVLSGHVVDFELTGEGAGAPVVLAHARPFSRWYLPLVAALPGRTVLRYERPAPDDPSFGIADDAQLCAQLVAHVGFESPHVVGHSYGALVALELARQGVVDTRSLALVEPATSGLLPREEAEASMAPLLEAARSAGPAATMDTFLGAVCGEGGAERLDDLVPGAVDEARRHAAGFFSVEMPAILRWSFTEADAAALDVPVLNVVGSASAPRFLRGAEILDTWFPASPAQVVPGATHLLPAESPAALAAVLEAFWRST